jgi:hypothetical protein
MDADPRSGGHRPSDRLARLAHVAELERVVSRQFGLEERPRLPRVRVSAPGEDGGKHLAHAEFRGQRLDLRPLARFA